MDDIKTSRRIEQDQIFLIIKGLALFFCTYPLFELFFQYPSSSSFNELNLQTLLTSFILILMVLCVWLLLNTRKTSSRWSLWMEIAIFYVICLISILFSGAHQSSYKFLFIYLVVAYTIQANQKTGFVITALVSATLFLLDVMTYKGGGVNKSIQSDVALSMFFLMITYILGRLANVEKKYTEALTRLANVDGLTGFYNHRCFFDAINNAYEKAKISGEPLSMVMFDIDYFKQYNDIFGHQKGDTVLRDVAACMSRQLTKGDILCRYGGEEFALILKNTSLADARERAEKIRLAIHDHPFEGEQFITGGVLTVSAGVSQKYPEDKSYDDLIARADSALYRAKYLRKNRVETYMDVFDQFTTMDDKMRDALIAAKALISVVNVRDSYTYSHTLRVVYNCELMAKAFALNEEDRTALIISASLHDLGKIVIPKDILMADQPLNDEEWEIISKHPEESFNIVSKIDGLETVANIVRQHHERFDGTGYPDGLKGDQIHPLARMLSLADSFDAMTCDRPYKKAKTYSNALKEIRELKGLQYDPDMADRFIQTIQMLVEKNDYNNNL